MKTKAEKIVKDFKKKLDKGKRAITFQEVFDKAEGKQSVRHVEEKRVITFACSDGSLFVGQFIPAIEGGLTLEAIRVAT
jgi:hypothetical protein